MTKRIPAADRVGEKFNRLLCLSVFREDKWYGNFQCDCGTTCVKPLTAVTSGNTRSCGCLSRENLMRRNVKHGMAGSKLYMVWSEMVSRCTNPKHVRYADYGGRGIYVCERWLDFANFLADVGEKPFDGATIDRVDNNKGYDPENVRWADKYTQANNKRNNRVVTAFGWSIGISRLAALIGIGSSELNQRMNKEHIEEYLMRKVGQDGVEQLCLTL